MRSDEKTYTREEAVEVVRELHRRVNTSSLEDLVDTLAALGVLRLLPARLLPPAGSTRALWWLRHAQHGRVRAAYTDSFWRLGRYVPAPQSGEVYDCMSAEWAAANGWRLDEDQESPLGDEQARQPEPEPEPAPARCAPPPQHAHKRWHWLCTGISGTLIVSEWSASTASWRSSGDNRVHKPEAYARYGWSYVAPCEEPMEKAD